jgi:hypothetical protein
MVSPLAATLRDRLDEAEVVVRVERRGYDTSPGRPDSVVWLRPSNVPVDDLIPLLVELEGARNTTASYHASKRDLAEFARRHDPDKRSATDGYQYHLAWPTLDGALPAIRDGEHSTDPMTDPAPLTVPVEYELFSVPASTVAGDRQACDADLQKRLRQHFRRGRRGQTTPKGFATTTTITRYGATEIVTWEVSWKLHNGHQGTVAVPFVVQAGPGVKQVLSEAVSPITVPMMAVLNGSPPARTESKVHETGVRFPNVSPAVIRRGKAGGSIK